jgi:hypothetical protein
VLDRLGGIGAYSNEEAIQPGDIPILVGDRLFVEVSEHPDESLAKELKDAPYSRILAQVIRHINQGLHDNATLTNEDPWDIPRNHFGKKDPSKLEKNDRAGHKISTVAQPRNLIGYLWLRIQNQFEKTPDINYYPCSNFENCDQELPIMSDVSRRKWCSDACRMR